jgi:hypothetical protein
MKPMQSISAQCPGLGPERVGSPMRTATPIRHAGVLALLAAGLAGCGADPQPGPDTPAGTAGLAGTAAVTASQASAVAAAPAPAAAPPAARSPKVDASEPPTGSLHMALLPFGEMPLADGRVERSYRLRLDNKGAALPAATLELAEVPPGVEVVRGRIGTAALAAQASSSPSETLILRFRQTLDVDVSSLAWRWTAATPRAAHPVARLLRGDPAARAVTALETLAPVSDGSSGDRLLALLAPQAQVADVNTALRQTQLHIEEMRPGNHTLVLTRAGLGAGPLAQAASRLQASGAFERVTLVRPAVQPVGGGPSVAGTASAGDSRPYDGTVLDVCSD